MTRLKATSQSKAAGISLIEVLIAVVVLSIGLLALAALQGALIRGSSSAKAQTQAMALAQESMEQLRGFKTAAGNTDSYSAIAGATDSVTIGGNTFTRTIAVTRYQYKANVGSSGGSFVTVSNNSTTVPIGVNEFKNVTVDVSWTNETGQTTDVQLADVISVSAPADSLSSLATPAAGHHGPQVWLDPTKFAPGVIPIALGNSQSAAASDPQPETFSTGHITTRFSVQNYNTTPNSNGYVLLNKQFDFALTSCTCNMGSASTTNNPAYGPTYWNGAKYIAPSTVTGKATGTDPVSNGNANNSSQDPVLCQACCRDHHDTTVSSTYPVKFDPFRPSTEFSSGEHKHYDTNNSNVLQTSAVSTASGTEYYETCRMVRVDGINYVATDAREENHILVAPISPITITSTTVTCDPNGDTITSGTCQDHSLDSTTSGTTYPNFVKDYVTGFYTAWLSADSAGTYPLPAGSVTPAVGDLLVSGGSPSTLATTYASLINAPTQTTLSLSTNETQYLEARGVYIDYISAETKKALACIGQPSSNTDCTAYRTSTVLQIMPFIAVNQTNLDSWRRSTAGTSISVTNAPIPTGGTYDPEVTGYKFDRGTVSTLVAGSDTAIAQARLGNSGLIDSLSVSPSYPFEAYNCLDTSTSASQSPCSADPPASGFAYDTSTASGPRFQADLQPYTVTAPVTATNLPFSVSYTDNSVVARGKSNFNSGGIALSVTTPTLTPSSLVNCTLGNGNKQPYTCYSTSTDTSVVIQFANYNSTISGCKVDVNTTCVNDYKLCSITGLPVTVAANAYPFTVTNSTASNEKTSVTLTITPGASTITAILAALNITANFYDQSATCP